MVSTADVHPTTGAGLLKLNVCGVVVPAAAVYELLVPHASEKSFASWTVSPKLVKLTLVMYMRCANANVTTYGLTCR